MAEQVKLPRLLAAAKEFNVGQETIIEFLAGKGFSRDDLKATAKLTEEMYRSLQQEFQGDKVAKNKADQIEIPKSAPVEKKRKDEEIILKKEEKKAPASQPTPSDTEKEMPAPEREAETTIAQPTLQKVYNEENKTSLKETTAKEEALNTKAASEEKSSTIRVESPKIEGPKVISKIDLSAIESSTHPKKAPQKTQKPKESKEETVRPKEAPLPKTQKKEVKTEETSIQVPQLGTVENIKAEKLEGPKVLGKIELPVEPNRSKLAGDEKRKRKRIPLEKKPDTNRPSHGHHVPTDRRPPMFPHHKPDRKPQHEEKEIDQKEIQDKIRETQAKLVGSLGRGKSQKAKHRRAKREEAAELAGEMENSKKLQVTEFVTVSELANLMDVSFADVISKCMNLGIMVSINQRLDAEVIELVAGEFGYEVEFIGLDDLEKEEEEEVDLPENLQPRAPIVTIMGHVDHGKTSLLDYIRSANVVAGEAGGITQHIGAYEVTLPNEKHITFLDTPGHEAFTAMRARGAKVTDIAVIVIAADDAVMPQTKEAISHAQAANVPMIFAINKIDKEGANPQKIYEQLSQMNLLVEEWGGKYQSQEISAKKGLNVDLLLDKILLEAELLDLKANPNRPASGTVIEASLDKGRGYVATILVQNGTLHHSDILVAGQYFGRVKAMFNERNLRVEEAPPSTPVQILGLNGAPQAGERFKVYADEAEAKELANKRAQIAREQGLRARKHITLDEIGRRLALGNFKELNVIIKGDVDGSVEALSDSLQKLSTNEVAVNVVHKAVGQISESDVLLATASDAVIIGFNVRPSLQANRLAENEGVQIKSYSIIYKAIEEVKSAMEGMLEPKVEEKEVATVEIKELFKFDKTNVAGCYVLEGKIKRDSKIRLFRDGILTYPRQEGAFAELGSLKRFKDDVKEVSAGYECGLTIKNFTDFAVGDTIVAYEEEEIKRTL